MRATLLGCLLLTLWTFVPCSARAAGGSVYLDSNGNGQRDAGEPGVAGVLVSDGAQVAASDGQGRWELHADEPRLLLRISVPRDHAAPAGFWRWAECDANADFPLLRRSQTNEFLFVQITDSHVGRADLVQQLVERFNTFPRPLAFVVNTGDLVGGADTVLPDKAEKQYDAYLSAVAGLKVPLWNLPGNHEHVAFHVKEADTHDPRYGKGLYQQRLGPMHYSWDWGPVHFVALDGTTLPYKEKLGPRQLAWLAADLGFQPQDKPVVLFCHQPLPSLADAEELARLLKGRRVLAAFCGHLHTTSEARWGEIPVYLTGALSGAWWSSANPDGTPQGFRLVQVAAGELKTAYFNREGAHFPAVVAPLATEVIAGQVEFAVNVLDFGQPVEVTARFDRRVADVALARREPLWSTWKGTFDSRQAYDGARRLKVESQLGNTMSWTDMRWLVVNGRPEPFHADAPAELLVQVRAMNADAAVEFNGRALGVIPGRTANETVLKFPVPADRLARLNRVTIRAGIERGKDRDDFSAGPIHLEYKGRKLYDLRYPTFHRNALGDARPDRDKPQRDVYFCLP